MKLKDKLANEYAAKITKNDTYKKLLITAFEEGWKQSAEYIANFPVFDGVYTINQAIAEESGKLLEMLKQDVLDIIEEEI